MTVRINPAYEIPIGAEFLRVHIPTQLWLAEDGNEFVRIPGPDYNVIVPVGLPGPMMAKIEFSKPLSFDRFVHNLEIGADIIAAVDIHGQNVGYPMSDTDDRVRADIMLNLQWQDCRTCVEC